MPGIGIGLGLGMGAGRASGPRFDYYVDSVNGSDSNDGLTADTAFATIGKLATVTGGDYSGLRLSFARGSYWREALLDSDASNVVVAAHGSGPLPVFDAADVADNADFSVSGELTNTYEISWAHSSAADSGKVRFSVFEDGVRLARVTSAENCDATPGSFYAPAPQAGTTQTIYVHPTDSTNPTSDGKLYEISARDFGIKLGASARVSSVRTKRQMHNDGSLVLGPGSLVEGCICEDGTIHNLSVPSGVVDGCILNRGEAIAGSGTTTLFVAYANDPTALAVTLRRCVFIGNGTSSDGQVGVYAHGQNGSLNYGEVTVEDCAFYGLKEAIGAGAIENLYTARNRYRECTIDINNIYRNLTAVDDWVDAASTDPALVTIRIYNASGALGTVSVEGLRAAIRQTSGAGVWSGTGVQSISKSVICFLNKTGFPHIPIRAGAGDLTIERCVITDASSFVEVASGAKYASDYNCIYPASTDAIHDGTTYSTIAAYVSATGQDTNSVTGDPLVTDPANGDFSLGEGSPAAAIGAGLERPNITYTAIPSDEEIKAM